MTTRGRNSSADWDPMKDDFNNTSYDAQYQDNDNGSCNGQSLEHRKLYITNIPAGLNEQGLRSAFEKYGQIEQAFLSKDPNKKYGLIRFETAAEARIAMMKLNRTEPLNLNVNIAHAKNSSTPSNNNGQNTNGTRDRDRGYKTGERGHRDSDRGYKNSERDQRDNDRVHRDNDRVYRDNDRVHRDNDRVHRDSDRVHRDSGSHVSSTTKERKAR